MAMPSLHTVTKQEGMRVPILEKRNEESGLVVLPLAWVHSRVAACGALLHPELSSLGYAGVCLFLTPTTWL